VERREAEFLTDLGVKVGTVGDDEIIGVIYWRPLREVSAYVARKGEVAWSCLKSEPLTCLLRGG
jgi:hypothetical protein